MSHDTHSHTPAATGDELFSAEERKALVQEDLNAARSLAYLMNGVFLIGILIYSIVALSIGV